MEEDAKLFETMGSTRAMRRLKTDPVPRELIEQILRAGQTAPSGGNAQNWGFIVVEDAEIKKQVTALYQSSWDKLAGPHYDRQIEALEPGEARDKLQRQVDAAKHLTDHFDEAPVWIVACLEVGPRGATAMHGASIYPAVQNMLLAARALGLGATLTCRHMVDQDAVDAVFGLPDGVSSFAILPIGYPKGNFGPVARGPLEEAAHLNKWGHPYV